MSARYATVPRVMVLGLDGATYDVLTPLAHSGSMPNLARLMDTSALAQLNSTRPYITPVAWTTFQTGCDPQQHGIWDYRYVDHQQGRVLMNHAGRTACPTLFDVVSQSGGDVASLNLPMTYSPTPAKARGIVVGGLDSPSMEAAWAHLPEFAARMQAEGVAYDLSAVWRRKPTSLEELSAGVARTQASFRGQVTAARVADQMTDWQLMIVQFQALDALQHRCWDWLGVSDETSHGPADWIAKTRESLVALDDCIGDLLELAQRRGAAVLAVSDHGFGSFREKINVLELLAARGLVQWPRGGAWFHHQVWRGRWKFRKLMQKCLSQNCSTASLSRPMQALAPIDWRRSRAIALHGNLGGLIYLNTRRRFGVGPLEIPRQYDQAADETIAAFVEARHSVTGEALFEEVYSTQQRFGVDPLSQMSPDIVAIPAPGFHTRHKFDPTSQLCRPDPTLTGTHRLEGVLMVNSPGVALGHSLTAELRDVAPTILQLLDLAAPASMQGRVLTEILPRSNVPTAAHFDLPRIAIPAASISAAEQASVEARLRDLGYME